MILQDWQGYLIAVVVGLLVGVERERAQPDAKAMGVRTFLFIAILGAIAGGLENAMVAALIGAFAFGLILVSYVPQALGTDTRADRGLTTEFAAGIVFCLGFVAHESPALSAVAGPVVAMILFSKPWLHRFTVSIRSSELEAALLLVLAGVAVVNLVPDRAVDPWGVFNPRKFGYLIVALAVLEFSSYVLTKVFGERRGALVAGFFGGLVSSTAVLLSTARTASASPGKWRTQLCSALAAKLASFLELFLIVGLVSPVLLGRLALPVGAGIVVGGIALAILAREGAEPAVKLDLKSPLDWRGVLRLSVTLTAILALISLAELWLGAGATLAISFVTGLFELHGVSLANATMQGQGQLGLGAATGGVLLAVVASQVAKIVLAWALAGGVYARVLTLVLSLMITTMAAAAWLLWRLL